MARHVLDPWACEQDARRLHELAEELRGLEIRDASLHAAVEAYRVEVDHLAEDYGRLAAAYQNSADLPPQEAQRLRSTLSHGVLSHAASMNVLRAQVQSACNNL
jgi:multidrug resistance efflux pump